jgi:hypothetical protein
MGRPFPGEEKAIEEIKALSLEAKAVLAHHLNNSLTVISGAVDLGRSEIAAEAIAHMVSDLEMFGIRDTFGINRAIGRALQEGEYESR